MKFRQKKEILNKKMKFEQKMKFGEKKWNFENENEIKKKENEILIQKNKILVKNLFGARRNFLTKLTIYENSGSNICNTIVVNIEYLPSFNIKT